MVKIVKIARLIGGAGTGKTTRMKEIAEKALARREMGGNPFSLGFSSFTRAARTEAANRCGAAWGVAPADLTTHGWFRTAHSVCYRQLGVSRGEIISGSKEDVKWVSEAVDSDVAFSMDEEEGGAGVYTGDPVAAAALNYWSLARNVVRPLREIVEADPDPDAPSADEVVRRITMFEQAKRLDARLDFTDLLARFVGVKFDPEHGPIECQPDGEVPRDVVGWIFDEAQDASKLLDMACRRLLTGDSVLWGWAVGDPYQVLYSWGGASAEHFMSWEVGDNQKIMPQSWRCPAPIMQLGERCLQRLDDYWDRGIAPAPHDGVVIESDNYEDDIAGCSPTEDTLIIARTNRNVSKIARMLDDSGVPFRYVKARDGVLKRDAGMAGLWSLERGEGISGQQWEAITEILPSKTSSGDELLVRGSKARWKKEWHARYDRVYPEDLSDLGATEHLRGVISSGSWPSLPDGGQKWAQAAKQWGVEAVSEPKIRIGTVHSAKGMEASKVIVATAVNWRIRDAEENSPEKFAEERRIEYVACTRAKHKLIIAHDPRSKYRMEIPV